MVTPAVEGIDLFKIANRSISGWIPNCARTGSLAPSKGLLRFPSHDKRKTNAPMTGVRWAMRETIWEVVEGVSK